MKRCPYCAEEIQDEAIRCRYCGADLNVPPPPPHVDYEPTPREAGNHAEDSRYEEQLRRFETYNNAFDECPEGKSRGVTALLALLLGGLGVQYFYLGKVGGGLLTILLSIVTCGIWQVLMLIQGILLFCMTNTEFRRKYVLSTSTMPLF